MKAKYKLKLDYHKYLKGEKDKTLKHKLLASDY